MKTRTIIFLLVLTPLTSNTVLATEDRKAKQAELDEACEVAREQKLAPMRLQYIEECQEKERRDKAYCERFYKDYGAQSGNRAPLFYDLPECVEAFDYKKSNRRR